MHDEHLKSVVAQALGLWNVQAPALTAHVAGPNVVVEVPAPDSASMYLRLTPQAHRTPEQLLAELEFVQYLQARGGPAAGVVAARDGAMLHSIEHEGRAWHAAVFAEAPGDRISWGDHEHNQRICRAIGEALGRIHALSRTFQPRLRRFDWREDRGFRQLPERLPDFEAPIKRRAVETFAFLETLPVTSDNFGMIHGDFTPANLRLHEDRITAFDFDDCCYHFYGFDLAVALLPAARLQKTIRLDYLHSILDGYAGHCPLNDFQTHIDSFWQACCLWRYLHALRNWDLVNLPEPQIKELANRRDAVINPISWREID